jgi:hypothetical protein
MKVKANKTTNNWHYFSARKIKRAADIVNTFATNVMKTGASSARISPLPMGCPIGQRTTSSENNPGLIKE